MLVDQPVTPCLPGTPHGCRPRSSPRQGQPRRRLGEEDTHAQGMLVKFGDVLDVFAFTCLAVLKLLHRVGMRALSSVRESRLSSRHAQGTVQRRQSTSATLPVWPWISPSPLRAPPVVQSDPGDHGQVPSSSSLCIVDRQFVTGRRGLCPAVAPGGLAHLPAPTNFAPRRPWSRSSPAHAPSLMFSLFLPRSDTSRKDIKAYDTHKLSLAVSVTPVKKNQVGPA